MIELATYEEFELACYNGSFSVQCHAFLCPVVFRSQDEQNWEVCFGLRPRGAGYAILGKPSGGVMAGFLVVGVFAGFHAAISFVAKLARMCTRKDEPILVLKGAVETGEDVVSIVAERPADPDSAAVMAMSLAFELEAGSRAHRDECVKRVKSIAVRRDIGEEGFHEGVMGNVVFAPSDEDEEEDEGALRPAIPNGGREELVLKPVTDPIIPIAPEPKAAGSVEMPVKEHDVMSGLSRAASVTIAPEVVATRTQTVKASAGGRFLALIPSVDRERLIQCRLTSALNGMIGEKLK